MNYPMKTLPARGTSVSNHRPAAPDAPLVDRADCSRRSCAPWPRFGRTFIGLTALMVLSACSLPRAQPDLTRFYLLNEVPHKADVAEVVGEPPRIVLRPVIVPDYLRGRIMQVRIADNELRFIDQARWAEPLESGLTRVLREDLSQRPARVRVVARASDEHDFVVAVNLRRCEGLMPAGSARLAARIEVFSSGPEASLVAQEDFTFDVSGWDGADYGMLASKLSLAADALTERIVTLLPPKK